MYLLTELLFSLPLAVYTYARILSMLKRLGAKLAFTAGFMILLAGYPVAETLSHRGASGWARIVMIAGYDALPLLMYLILTVLLSDLVIAALRGLKILSRETVRGPGFCRARLAVALLIPVVVVAAGIWNYGHLRIREYTIEVPRYSATLEELTIAYAADLHLGSITGRDFMRNFVDKINAAAPDIVLIGGDILEGHGQGEDAVEYEAEFHRLYPKYGVYAAPGNHEGYGGRRTAFLERAGIRLLEDAVVKIDDAIYLAGRNDAHSRKRMPVADLLRDVPHDLPIVVLDHRPTDLENIARAGADIQLSGHTHHGQLFPVNWLTAREYELSWGHMVKDRTHVFVTSGIQVWGPPVRTVGYSEILLIHVRFK